MNTSKQLWTKEASFRHAYLQKLQNVISLYKLEYIEYSLLLWVYLSSNMQCLSCVCLAYPILACLEEEYLIHKIWEL